MTDRRFTFKVAAWLTAAIALVFAVSWWFVQAKTEDCRLLCGQDARENATYQVGGTLGGRSSVPHASRCNCAAPIP
ncbi:hypothetical protein [Ideonella sp.]|uniref:hypothetical protein n=1 Tax=Ideonella sp. TaxID=1929293 RepID=UPI003BB58CDD